MERMSGEKGLTVEQLARRKTISEVKLNLESTDIPWDFIPTNGASRLILPTSARLRLVGEVLSIEMIVHDPEAWAEQYYEPPTFDDENPPIITLSLHKEEILRLVVGDYNYRHQPIATLVITDPGEVVDSLQLTFASTDSNNPEYAIRALMKILRHCFDVTIEELQHAPESRRDELDIPF
jgi:hypothetical protein